jgi:hypothetical protein
LLSNPKKLNLLSLPISRLIQPQLQEVQHALAAPLVQFLSENFDSNLQPQQESLRANSKHLLKFPKMEQTLVEPVSKLSNVPELAPLVAGSFRPYDLLDCNDDNIGRQKLRI